MFVPHRKHTCRPPWTVTGNTVLSWFKDFIFPLSVISYKNGDKCLVIFVSVYLLPKFRNIFYVMSAALWDLMTLRSPGARLRTGVREHILRGGTRTHHTGVREYILRGYANTSYEGYANISYGGTRTHLTGVREHILRGYANTSYGGMPTHLTGVRKHILRGYGNTSYGCTRAHFTGVREQIKHILRGYVKLEKEMLFRDKH
jgi:hypothetical protein